VGSGAARSSGAKNRAGSGSTVDAARGKTGAPGDGGGSWGGMSGSGGGDG
jgi:hypothetical protein